MSTHQSQARRWAHRSVRWTSNSVGRQLCLRTEIRAETRPRGGGGQFHPAFSWPWQGRERVGRIVRMGWFCRSLDHLSCFSKEPEGSLCSGGRRALPCLMQCNVQQPGLGLGSEPGPGDGGKASGSLQCQGEDTVVSLARAPPPIQRVVGAAGGQAQSCSYLLWPEHPLKGWQRGKDRNGRAASAWEQNRAPQRCRALACAQLARDQIQAT